MTISQHLTKFLKDQGAYNKFIYNLQKEKYIRIPKYLEELHNRNVPYKLAILYAFEWFATKQGVAYWENLDKLWNVYYSNNIFE